MMAIPAVISPFSNAVKKGGMLSKHLAIPYESVLVKVQVQQHYIIKRTSKRKPSLPVIFATAVSGARFPRRIVK